MHIQAAGYFPSSGSCQRINMKQQKLVGDIFDFGRNGPLLLINQFPLFQCSKAIFSADIKPLTLTLAQNIHALTCFEMHIKASGNSPSSGRYSRINMKQQKLVGDIFEFCRNGPLLLINQCPLFQYSQAIFSVSIKLLALTLAQNIHTLTCFLMHIQAAGNSRSSRSYQRINMKRQKLVGDIFEFCRNGPLLLINQFPLLQYSQAIFSVSIKPLALTLAQNIHPLTCFLMHIQAAANSPSSGSYQRINMKSRNWWGTSSILGGMAHFCSLTNFHCYNIHR